MQSFLCHFADADGADVADVAEHVAAADDGVDADGEALSADADVAEHGADADDDGGLCGNKPWIQI